MKTEIEQLAETIAKLVNGGHRFTLINNPEERTAKIISITKADIIKNKFPEFHIYLNAHQQKTVERVFVFGR